MPYGFWLHKLNHFLTKAIVLKLSLLLMFTLLNKVKKRDWNYAATEVYKNKLRFRKRIKHIWWFTYFLLHLYYYIKLNYYKWCLLSKIIFYKLKTTKKCENVKIICSLYIFKFRCLYKQSMIEKYDYIPIHFRGVHSTTGVLTTLKNFKAYYQNKRNHKCNYPM